MATRKTTTRKTRKAPAKVQETKVEEVEKTPDSKAGSDRLKVEAAVDALVEATGVTAKEARYKMGRALGYTAILNVINEGDEALESLVNQASETINDLPFGWSLGAHAPGSSKAVEEPVQEELDLDYEVEEEVEETEPDTVENDEEEQVEEKPAPKRKLRRRPSKK